MGDAGQTHARLQIKVRWEYLTGSQRAGTGAGTEQRKLACATHSGSCDLPGVIHSLGIEGKIEIRCRVQK